MQWGLERYYTLHLVFAKFMGAQVIDTLCVLHSPLSVFWSQNTRTYTGVCDLRTFSVHFSSLEVWIAHVPSQNMHVYNVCRCPTCVVFVYVCVYFSSLEMDIICQRVCNWTNIHICMSAPTYLHKLCLYEFKMHNIHFVCYETYLRVYGNNLRILSDVLCTC